MACKRLRLASGHWRWFRNNCHQVDGWRRGAEALWNLISLPTEEKSHELPGGIFMDSAQDSWNFGGGILGTLAQWSSGCNPLSASTTTWKAGIPPLPAACPAVCCCRHWFRRWKLMGHWMERASQTADCRLEIAEHRLEGIGASFTSSPAFLTYLGRCLPNCNHFRLHEVTTRSPRDAISFASKDTPSITALETHCKGNNHRSMSPTPLASSQGHPKRMSSRISSVTARNGGSRGSLLALRKPPC